MVCRTGRISLVIWLCASTAFAGINFSSMKGKPKPNFSNISTRQEILYYLIWLNENDLYDKMDDDMYKRLKIKAEKVNIKVRKRNQVGAEIKAFMRPLYNKGNFYKGVYYP